MKRLLLVAALIPLLVPAQAQAHRTHRHKPHAVRRYALTPIQIAEADATAYWAEAHLAMPCPTGIHVVYGPAPAASEVNGGPMQDAIKSGAAIVRAWARLGDATCTVHMNEAEWDQEVLNEHGEPGNGIDAEYFHEVCDVMTHELGHFVGDEDEGQVDPHAIGYPTIERGSPNYDSVPQCLKGAYA